MFLREPQLPKNNRKKTTIPRPRSSGQPCVPNPTSDATALRSAANASAIGGGRDGKRATECCDVDGLRIHAVPVHDTSEPDDHLLVGGATATDRTTAATHGSHPAAAASGPWPSLLISLQEVVDGAVLRCPPAELLSSI